MTSERILNFAFYLILISHFIFENCIYLLLLFFKYYLWVYYLNWSSLLGRLFSSCGEWGLLSSCGVWASHSSDSSCCRAWALGCTGFRSCGRRGLSICSSWALEHRLCSCGPLALLLRGTRDLSRPGIEPMTPTLQADSLPLSHQGSPLL